MSHLDLWEKVRQVPQTAAKPIAGGRLKGMTDIKPMWRLKALTEQFGACGVGWKYEVADKQIHTGANGEIAVFVDINLYIKVDGAWSEPIPGMGGSMFVTKERNGLYTSDECFKMALTDAISVSCKALGVGADVYWQEDKTKYNNDSQPQQEKIDSAKVKVITDLLEKTKSDVPAFLKYYKIAYVEDMTVDVFAKAVKALKSKEGA